jgi:LysR family transcriptional regulator, regulator of abg operon
MALDAKRLIDLLRISEHGSYTRAAAAEGVSQPALSNSIAILEKELGIRVLERTRRGATLTDYGRLLVSHAALLESLLARAGEDVRLKKLGLEGSLSIGVSPIACAEIVPDAVARLKQDTPNVRIMVEQRPDDTLLRQLRMGEIDLMISPAGLLSDPPDIERQLLFYDSLIVIAAPDNPIARRRSISLSELRDATWAMPDAQTALSRHVEALFAAEDMRWPLNCVVTNSMTAIRSLVMRGGCVSITSKMLVALELRAGFLAGIRLRGQDFDREISLRTRRNSKAAPLVERFAAHLRGVAAEIKAGPRRKASTARRR